MLCLLVQLCIIALSDHPELVSFVGCRPSFVGKKGGHTDTDTDTDGNGRIIHGTRTLTLAIDNLVEAWLLRRDEPRCPNADNAVLWQVWYIR